MFYQLKSFKLENGEAPSDSTVAQQAGMLAAAFTGAQFLTAIMWGRLADSEMFGRKRVILIGLLGTAIGSLGFGFSSSFAVAMFWRAIGGSLNGNMVCPPQPQRPILTRRTNTDVRGSCAL
jgi:MFS family permease